MEYRPVSPNTTYAPLSGTSHSPGPQKVITQEELTKLATSYRGMTFDRGTHYIVKSDLRGCTVLEIKDMGYTIRREG